MKIASEKLTDELIEATQKLIQRAEKIKTVSESQLNTRPSSESWSALETLEHLNLYGDFYNPEINQRLTGNTSQNQDTFKSGVIGNWFVGLMEPKEKLNTMKTFADKNPLGSALDKSTIERFLAQQEEFLKLLNASRKVSLSKTKTSISISKVLKLKLGDTFRFIVAHNQRHLDQAERALQVGNAN
jgi:anion-transporting  ArsA/GET3 family ATPase